MTTAHDPRWTDDVPSQRRTLALARERIPNMCPCRRCIDWRHIKRGVWKAHLDTSPLALPLVPIPYIREILDAVASSHETPAHPSATLNPPTS